MRRLRSCLLLMAALACAPPAWASAPAAGHDDPAGPRFGGYSTERDRAVSRRVDLARIEQAQAPQVAAIATAVAGLSPPAQLDAVNRRINRMPARDDRELYGVDDHWATPREFFRNRGGDCEDYAIAKYAVLERLGWPPAHMWIVVLRETVISLAHAVLVVEHGGRLWTLDNLGDPVFEVGTIDYYRPVYSLNHFGAWSHHPRTARSTREAADLD